MDVIFCSFHVAPDQLMSTFPVPFSKKPEVQATNVNTSRGAYFLIITEITPEYVLLSSNYYSNATYVNLLAFTLDS